MSTATKATQAAGVARTEQHATRPGRVWAPKMWEGCPFGTWVKLLVRNRFAIEWRQWHTGVIITFVSLGHSLLGGLERLIYRRKVARTTFPADPIFVVGHWRTGTTLLHEMLALDPRHTSPTTYSCLEPNHFLLTERLVTRWLSILVPERRPMDGMAAGWDKPQEDEFALCMLGQPSPYRTIAFPNRPPQCPEAFDLRGLTPAQLEGWGNALVGFLRRLTFRDPRRLVLKSPTHSFRIPTLLKLFPDARFVRIVRDPRVVFPSTVHLWKSLYRTHGLQSPRFEHLHEYVFSTFVKLHDALEQGMRLVPRSRRHEVRYEDLVADPVGQMRSLYESLQLDGFEALRPRLEQYLAKSDGYRPNRYETDPALLAEVQRRWGRVIEEQGYGEESRAAEEVPAASS